MKGKVKIGGMWDRWPVAGFVLDWALIFFACWAVSAMPLISATNYEMAQRFQEIGEKGVYALAGVFMPLVSLTVFAFLLGLTFVRTHYVRLLNASLGNIKYCEGVEDEKSAGVLAELLAAHVRCFDLKAGWLRIRLPEYQHDVASCGLFGVAFYFLVLLVTLLGHMPGKPLIVVGLIVTALCRLGIVGGVAVFAALPEALQVVVEDDRVREKLEEISTLPESSNS